MKLLKADHIIVDVMRELDGQGIYPSGSLVCSHERLSHYDRLYVVRRRAKLLKAGVIALASSPTSLKHARWMGDTNEFCAGLNPSVEYIAEVRHAVRRTKVARYIGEYRSGSILRDAFARLCDDARQEEENMVLIGFPESHATIARMKAKTLAA